MNLNPESLAALRQSSEILAAVCDRAAKCDHLEARNKALQAENDSLRERHGVLHANIREARGTLSSVMPELDGQGLREMTEEAARRILNLREAARSKPSPHVGDAVSIALRLARHPVNDLERVELGRQILPHLRYGENVDTGALRILSDRVEWLEKQAEECRVALKQVAAGDVDSRVRRERDEARALVEKLISEINSLRGPVPPIARGEIDPPQEIIDLAWVLQDSMRANGYRDWRIAGVCDAGQVDRLTAELAEARAENGRQAATIAEARRQFDILSKLGNGDRVGNSDGNVIAAKALTAMCDVPHEAIQWNPYNEVVQDHRDGTVIQPDTDKERAKRGLPPFQPEPGPKSLRERIRHAINCCSAESGSDTPDFILAEALESVLKAFDVAVVARDNWYGGKPGRLRVETPNTGRDNRFFFQCWMEGGNQFPMNTNEGAAPEQPQLLDFGAALRALKEGKRVARQGWNGKGMWIALSGTQLRPSRVPVENLWSPHSRAEAEAQGGSVEVLPAIIMKNARGQIVMGWLASQEDMLCEDWVVLPDSSKWTREQIDEVIEATRKWKQQGIPMTLSFTVKDEAELQELIGIGLDALKTSG